MASLRALSLWNPHAGLMAVGVKRVETRGRTFGYRGPLAIASTASVPARYRAHLNALMRMPPFRGPLETAGWTHLGEMPAGYILALVWVDTESRITGGLMRATIEQTYGPDELKFGNYTDGRVAIHTNRARLIRLPEPVPCKGMQGLWTVPYGVLGQIVAQVGTHPAFHHYRDAIGAFAQSTLPPAQHDAGDGGRTAPPTTHPEG